MLTQTIPTTTNPMMITRMAFPPTWSEQPLALEVRHPDESTPRLAVFNGLMTKMVASLYRNFNAFRLISEQSYCLTLTCQALSWNRLQRQRDPQVPMPTSSCRTTRGYTAAAYSNLLR